LVLAEVPHGERPHAGDLQEALARRVDGEAAEVAGDPAAVELLGDGGRRAAAAEAIAALLGRVSIKKPRNWWDLHGCPGGADAPRQGGGRSRDSTSRRRASSSRRRSHGSSSARALVPSHRGGSGAPSSHST